MLTNIERDGILNSFDNHFVGLLTAISDWRTPTVTEASYTGYGTRPGLTLGSVGNTNPAGGRQRANSVPCVFPQNTGSNQDVIGWGLYAAATGGSPKWISLLDADPPVIGTAAASDTITAPAHGLSNNQRVFVMAAPGAVLPAGLSENTPYFVVNAATDTFQLSATQGGAAVDITAAGAAMFLPFTARTIAAGATPQFDVGALVLQI